MEERVEDVQRLWLLQRYDAWIAVEMWLRPEGRDDRRYLDCDCCKRYDASDKTDAGGRGRG